jgi:hypothetical protein
MIYNDLTQVDAYHSRGYGARRRDAGGAAGDGLSADGADAARRHVSLRLRAALAQRRTEGHGKRNHVKGRNMVWA